ncbi:MAG TPA: hypothetical protein VHV83_12750 [Armatimonadota bacterium]|nr:hypothetical protein [Armatimonadota bacterium]
MRLTLFEAMTGQYTHASSGVRDTNNRAILAKRGMERLQMLSQEPMVMNNPKRRYALLYDALQANGTSDPTRYLGSEEEWMAAGQAPMAGNQPSPGGNPPPSAANTGPVPPEIAALAQQLNMPPEAVMAQVMALAQQNNMPPEAVVAQLQARANGGPGQPGNPSAPAGQVPPEIAALAQQLHMPPEAVMAQVMTLAQQNNVPPEAVVAELQKRVSGEQGQPGGASPAPANAGPIPPEITALAEQMHIAPEAAIAVVMELAKQNQLSPEAVVAQLLERLRSGQEHPGGTPPPSAQAETGGVNHAG